MVIFSEVTLIFCVVKKDMFDEMLDQLKTKRQAVFKVKVIPKSPKRVLRGVMADGTYKIGLTSAPEKGRANDELIDFLSEELGIDRRNIEIMSDKICRTTYNLKLIKFGMNKVNL